MRSVRHRGLAAACAFALVLAALSATPAAALRVVTWNLWQYPQSLLSTRQPHMRTVMGSIGADVVIVQELSTQAGADSFLFNVLRVAEPARVWKSAGYLVNAQSALFYDSVAVSIQNFSSFATSGPRDVLQALVRPRGYNALGASFRVYSIHFKAGNPATSPADSTTRRIECTDIRNQLNLAPAGTNLLLGGDTNFYGDWEGGYIRLTESQADNDGRLKDAHSLPGTWNVSTYRYHHSQCPCATGCLAGFSGGGLDSRFDFFLSSYPLNDGEGLDVVPGTSFPYGNDGMHYNTDVNGGGFNNAVGITIANALHDASDHLPAVVVLQVPAKVAAASQLDFGDAILGGAPAVNLAVANGATAPADELTYSLTAPAGFTAPAGSFAANAGDPANLHALGMDTAATGFKSGTLTVSSDDPDSALKSVLLTGRVLDHAAASLDSAAAVTELSLDFGQHAAGQFPDLPVRVHNLGWDALQARLAVNTAVITGGAGRFSIVGGFSPALLGGTGQTWSIRYDDAGATLDSLYQATLTFTTADEPLPGAQPAATLTVNLSAMASSVGVPDDRPVALAFLPPRPNPLSGETRFRFDLPASAPVSLEVFDLSGRRVAEVVSGELPAGRHEVRWSAGGAAGARLEAGLYFARFTTPGLARATRLILLP